MIQLGYFTLDTPDVEKARAFYAGLFGWTFDEEASHPTYAHVSGSEPAFGITKGEHRAFPHLYFRVDDIHAACTRVKELGGHAAMPAESPSGLSAVVADDQGVSFSLWQPAPAIELSLSPDDGSRYQRAMSEHASLPLATRIALVVGASRGIGYETALALAKAGAHVVAAARTQGGLEELDDAIFAATGQHATLVPFDLVDGGAIDRLGGALFERFGKLDIWVQAAATMGPSGLTPVAHAEPREFAKVEKINFTGVYRLIRSLEPLLRASDAGRAIYLTTSVAANPRAFWGMYAATKAGAENLVKCWADEVESTPIRVAVVDPSRMRTQMRAQAFPGEDPEVLPHPSEIGPLMVELARPDLTPPLTVSFKDWKQGLSAHVPA